MSNTRASDKDLLTLWVIATDEYEAALARQKLAIQESEAARAAVSAARDALLPLAPADETERFFVMPPTNSSRRLVVSIRQRSGTVYLQLKEAEVL